MYLQDKIEISSAEQSHSIWSSITHNLALTVDIFLLDFYQIKAFMCIKFNEIIVF